MKRRLTHIAGSILVMLAGCAANPAAAAQAPGRSSRSADDCRTVRGKLVDVFPGTGNVTIGTTTNAGFLNGTTEMRFNSAAFPTPEPSTVSYTAVLTITTTDGQLNVSNVFLYHFGTGLFTVLGRVNPETSTGRFAGATGVLFLNGETIGGGSTFRSILGGEICSIEK